jgi:hypothetical protein
LHSILNYFIQSMHKMREFTLKIFKDEGFPLVTFYTIQSEDKDLSETDQFFEAYMKHPIYKSALQQLIVLMEIMGKEKSAQKRFFRDENAAHALPPKGNKIDWLTFADSPLRLYCLRLSDQIVILFNGGVKKSQKVQDSPLLMSKFRAAQIWAKQITQAIIEKEIRIDDSQKKPYLTNSEGTPEILFYF